LAQERYIKKRKGTSGQGKVKRASKAKRMTDVGAEK
jgi:hypothetical protein